MKLRNRKRGSPHLVLSCVDGVDWLNDNTSAFSRSSLAICAGENFARNEARTAQNHPCRQTAGVGRYLLPDTALMLSSRAGFSLNAFRGGILLTCFMLLNSFSF